MGVGSCEDTYESTKSCAGDAPGDLEDSDEQERTDVRRWRECSHGVSYRQGAFAPFR